MIRGLGNRQLFLAPIAILAALSGSCTTTKEEQREDVPVVAINHIPSRAEVNFSVKPTPWDKYIEAIEAANTSIKLAVSEKEEFISGSQNVVAISYRLANNKMIDAPSIAMAEKDRAVGRHLYLEMLSRYGYAYFKFESELEIEAHESEQSLQEIVNKSSKLWGKLFNKILIKDASRLHPDTYKIQRLFDQSCILPSGEFHKKCLDDWINACAFEFSSHAGRLGKTKVTWDTTADPATIRETFAEVPIEKIRANLGFQNLTVGLFGNRPRDIEGKFNFDLEPYNSAFDPITDIPITACNHLASEGYTFYSFDFDEALNEIKRTLLYGKSAMETEKVCKTMNEGFIYEVVNQLNAIGRRMSSLDSVTKKEVLAAANLIDKCRRP